MSVENLQRQFADHSGHVLALAGDVRKHGDTLEAIKAELDKMNDQRAAFAATGGGKLDPQSKSKMFLALGEYARKGDNGELAHFPEVKASMSVQSDPDGGYTVIPEVDTSIRSLARDYNPLLNLATVRPTTYGSYSWLVDDSLIGTGWIGETEPRPATIAASLRKRTINCGELYAMPGMTQTLLDDAPGDIASFLTGKIGNAFATQIGTAVISGDGVKDKPVGILTYPIDTGADFERAFGSVQYVAAGSTTPTSTQLADAIIALSMTLRAPYRANASWLMSRDTARVVRQLKDSMGLYLWSDGGRLAEGAKPQLLGFDVNLSEDMPAFGANALPIAFGDWKQAYMILDRTGIRILRDPFTAKPNVLFYTTKRVGGGVLDFNAFKLLRIS